jgi:hypothetical protein
MLSFTKDDDSNNPVRPTWAAGGPLRGRNVQSRTLVSEISQGRLTELIYDMSYRAVDDLYCGPRFMITCRNKRFLSTCTELCSLSINQQPPYDEK